MTKEIAHLVSNNQVQKDSIWQPIGVSRNHSPFPPFLWKVWLQN